MEGQSVSREWLLRNIDALLSKTVENGCTPEEAETAAKKIDELLLKYNLSMSEIQRSTLEKEFSEEYIQETDEDGNPVFYGKKGIPSWLVDLRNAVGDFNFCEVIGSRYIGTKNDVDLAKYTFEVLMRKIRAQSYDEFKKWWKGRREEIKRYGGKVNRGQELLGENNPRVWTASWIHGACVGLASKLQNQVWARNHPENANNSTTGLVLHKQAIAREYAQSKYPHYYGIYTQKEQDEMAQYKKEMEERLKAMVNEPPKKRRGPKPKYHEYKEPFQPLWNREAFNAGRVAGGSISVDPGIKSGSESRKLER